MGIREFRDYCINNSRTDNLNEVSMAHKNFSIKLSRKPYYLIPAIGKNFESFLEVPLSLDNHAIQSCIDVVFLTPSSDVFITEIKTGWHTTGGTSQLEKQYNFVLNCFDVSPRCFYLRKKNDGTIFVDEITPRKIKN